jgi:hypothetical protein
MTAAEPIAATSSAPRRIGDLKVFANLLRKELAESRGIIIAGLTIFWLMPALWELLYWAVDPEHEFLPGFAWVLVVGAGWLYAIIVGGHTVCRDWGKAEEHFLLAQPVGPRWVISAKFIAGALVVAVVAAVAGLWDLCVSHVSDAVFSAGEHRALLVASTIAIGAMTLGYGVAFAAAVMTRQTLASIMVSGLVLVIWLAAPMLSGRLASLQPTLNLITPSSIKLESLFLLVVLAGPIACVCLALIWSTRERVIRLGYKPLAWSLALVVLALFSMAMTEVGNALRVKDQTLLYESVQRPKLHIYESHVARQGDRFYIVSPHWPPEQDLDWAMASFRVNEDGRIADIRRTTVPNPARSWPGNVDEYAWFRHLTLNEAGHFIATGHRMQLVPKAHDPNKHSRRRRGLWRIDFVWPEHGPLQVLSDSALQLPVEGRFQAKRAVSCASTDRYAYVLYYLPPEKKLPVPDRKRQTTMTLHVYEWSDGPNAQPRYEILLPRYCRKLELLDGTLTLYDERERPRITFDAEHPELLATSSAPSSSPSSQTIDLRSQALPFPADRPGGGSATGTCAQGLIYAVDRFGLRILQTGADGPWLTPVGEYLASPLSMVFYRPSWYPPRLLDNALLLHFPSGNEPVGPALVAYDVSEPTRPRRVGFFHGGFDTPWLQRNILATDRHLVMFQPVYVSGYWDNCRVTVLDRPR